MERENSEQNKQNNNNNNNNRKETLIWLKINKKESNLIKRHEWFKFYSSGSLTLFPRSEIGRKSIQATTSLDWCDNIIKIAAYKTCDNIIIISTC